MDNNKKKKNNIKINPNFKIKNIYNKQKPKSASSTKAPYKILKKIGEGSFGVVYLVHHIKTSSFCVMKKIDLTNLSKEEIKYNKIHRSKTYEKIYRNSNRICRERRSI